MSEAPPASPMTLAFTAPLDAAAVLGNLRAHAIPGAEIVDGERYTRLVATASGPALVTIEVTPDAVLATIDGPATLIPSGEPLLQLLRRWLDLDQDPAAIVAALSDDPVVGSLVRARPGLRVLGSIDPFETATMTVLGQQVSLAAARTFGGRLLSAFGEQGPGGLTVFPEPGVLAAAGADAIRQAVGLTGARARSLHSLASAVTDGMPLDGSGGASEFRSSLLALPGIGPWTADYLGVRVLGDRDGFVPGDLVLRKALGARLGREITAQEAEAASEAWRPYRAHALLQLWTNAAYAP